MTFAPHVRRIYVHAIRLTWDFESFGPLVPDVSASYALRVPRTGALLTASFRPHLAMMPLLFGYGFPSTGPQEDFHLQVIAPCPAHQKKGPATVRSQAQIFSRIAADIALLRQH